MRRSLAHVVVVLGMASSAPSAIADDMQIEGWPPKWEISQPEFAALQMAVERLKKESPDTPVADYRVVMLEKQDECLFLFLHRNRDDVSIRGCELPDMSAWEIGVSKDAARITRAIYPK